MQAPNTEQALFGARLTPDGTIFRVWALGHSEVELVLFDGEREVASHPMEGSPDGFFSLSLPGVGAGTRYKFRVDGAGPFPDPASRSQPEGVHGPSEVVDLAFDWQATDWQGLPLDSLVIYELHVGTVTPEGTFDALIARLDDIKALGVTAIEIMPVADFPGDRNWGYDGVFLFAPTRAYGGVRGLQRLVDAAHARGLAVLLDVVYNHLGPDGNYLGSYSSHYFTDRHKTPWGDAINFDGPNARPVRDFFIANALAWLHDFRLDGLRLDATHEIKDDSETHLIAELATTARASVGAERPIILIAENEGNNAHLVAPPDRGGWGLDGIWADDFHHQLRSALAGDNEGYYANYTGTTEDIVRTLQRGWFFDGRPLPTTGKPHGTSTDAMPYPAFVHCIQNHDQIGNRALGERLNHQISLPAYRAASALLLFGSATPLLFMGQEWAATTPFLFFTDHNPELGALVTEGRRAEFSSFAAFRGEATRERIPDPQAPETFQRSTLKWDERDEPPHVGVLALYRDLLALRRDHPALQPRSRTALEVAPVAPQALAICRTGANGEALLLVVNLGPALTLDLGTLPISQQGHWHLHLSTEALRYRGEEGIRLGAQTLFFDTPGAALLHP